MSGVAMAEGRRSGNEAAKLANSDRVSALAVPQGKRDGLESVLQLIVGSDREIRLPCSDADERDAQLVAQEAQQIEELAAAVALPGEDVVQLVDHQHAHSR